MTPATPYCTYRSAICHTIPLLLQGLSGQLERDILSSGKVYLKCSLYSKRACRHYLANYYFVLKNIILLTVTVLYEQ